MKESSNYVRRAGHQIEACVHAMRILGREPSDVHDKTPQIFYDQREQAGAHQALTSRCPIRRSGRT